MDQMDEFNASLNELALKICNNDQINSDAISISSCDEENRQQKQKKVILTKDSSKLEITEKDLIEKFLM